MEKNKSSLYVGYHVLTDDAIDDRLVLNKSDLSLVNASATGTDYSATRFPDTYFAVVKDSEDSENRTQLYVFDKTMTTNSETGLFHRVDYEYIKKHPKLNGIEIIGDHDGNYYLLQDKLIASEGINITSEHVIFVKVDGTTIVFNSEGELQTTVQPGIAIDTDLNKINVRFDNATIKVNSENKLFVPIDSETIFIDADGKIKAKPEALASGIATDAHYNANNSEVVDVRVDGITIKVSSENELYAEAPIEPGNGVKLVAGSSAAAKKINVVGSNTITVDSEVHVKSDNKTIVVGTDGVEVPIDNETIKINSDGKVIANPVVQGDGITVTPDNNAQRIDVNVDNATTQLTSDKVAVKLHANGAIIADGTNGIKVNPDSESIKIVGNKLVSGIGDGNVTKVNSTKTQIDVQHDNTLIESGTTATGKTLGVNIDNANGSVISNASGVLGVNADGTTIVIGTDGKLSAKALNAGKANAVNSETNVIDVLYDDSTIKLGTGTRYNKLYVPIDDLTIKTTGAGNTLTVNTDEQSITKDAATGALNVKLKDATLVKDASGSGLAVNKDDNTIVLESGKLVAKVTKGDAISLDTTAGNKISVKVDSETIKIVGDKLEAHELPNYTVANSEQYLRVNGTGKLEWAAAGKVDDVQINDVSIVNSSKVAKIPIAIDKLGAVFGESVATRGISIDADGKLSIVPASEGDINTRTTSTAKTKYGTITPELLDYAVKKALSDTKGVAYTSEEKKQTRIRIGLADVASSSEVATAIDLDLDSEYKLTASLLNIAGDVISSDMIDLPLENFLIDAWYEDAPTSEQYLGGTLYLKLKNGTIISIPLDQVINGLVTLATTQTIIGDKDFTGKITKLGKDVLSVEDIDNVTIKWNSSEDYIYATGVTVSEGVATEIISGGTTATGDTIKILNVKVDNATVKANDDNKLTVIVDSETIIKGTKGIEVPIDKKTIFIDSENKVAVNIDGTTLYYSTSENVLKASGVDVKAGDAVAITKDSESTATKIVNRIDVQYDSETIKLKSNKLYVDIDNESIIYGSEGKVKANVNKGLEIDGEINVLTDEKSITIDSENSVTTIQDDKSIRVGDDGLYVAIDSETIVLDSEDKLSVPIDNVTIFINSEGLLEASGLTVKSGDAIEIENSEEAGLPVGYINVLTDSETIIVNADNELEVVVDDVTIKHSASEGLHLPIDNITIIINSEGKLAATGVENGIATELVDSEGTGVKKVNVLVDEVTVIVNSENQLEIPIDKITITVNSEGKLQASGVKAGEAIELVDSENTGVNVVNVLYDDETIKLGTDNKLYLPIDSETIYVSSEGLLKARPEPLYDGVATHVYYNSADSEVVDVIYADPIIIDSEGKLSVAYDNQTIILDSEKQLIVNIDSESLYFDDSEQHIKVRTLTVDDVYRICV